MKNLSSQRETMSGEGGGITYADTALRSLKTLNKQRGTTRMGAALALVGVVALGQCAYVYGTGSERDITVNRLDHKIYGSGDDVQDKYLVFTDQGVFENTDSVLRLKFDSSDLQNLLREGENYRIETYGWRIPVLSCYPNIVKTTPIENNVEKE